MIPETSNYAVNEVINQNPLGELTGEGGLYRDADVLHRPRHRPPCRRSRQLSEAAAKQQLQQNGLKVSRVITQTSSSVPQGQVITTQPGPARVCPRARA